VVWAFICTTVVSADSLGANRPALPLPEVTPIEIEAGQLIGFDSEKSLKVNNMRRTAIKEKMDFYASALERFDLESICGLLDDSQHVESYNGSLGPSREFVAYEQSSTMQFQWREDLHSLFDDPDSEPGNVQGVRWCTGTLIGDNLVLTAGHCFDVDANGWSTPKRNGMSLLPEELAPLFNANFNFQRNPITKINRDPDVYPVVELLEYRHGSLDYAIVRLGVAQDGTAANQRYRTADFDSSVEALTNATALTMIQHPAGDPKKIEAGPKNNVMGSSITYSDLDTRGGSSGSGVLDSNGRIIAVHTHGGCRASGGTNGGVTLNSVARNSAIIQ